MTLETHHTKYRIARNFHWVQNFVPAKISCYTVTFGRYKVRAVVDICILVMDCHSCDSWHNTAGIVS